jgi:DNA-binding Xre family transcriptional regulator
MNIVTTDRLTILLGRLQATTGRRITLRGLAARAGVPKDLVYRLDAGEARYIDLEALSSLCRVLDCAPADILVWHNGEQPSGAASIATAAPGDGQRLTGALPGDGMGVAR